MRRIPEGGTVAGSDFFLKPEGHATNQIRRLGAGEYKYFQQHWPDNGIATLRVATYYLPSGARVLGSTPPDMSRRQLPDGCIELRTQKIIPPNGSITLRIRFHL